MIVVRGLVWYAHLGGAIYPLYSVYYAEWWSIPSGAEKDFSVVDISAVELVPTERVDILIKILVGGA